MSTDLFISSLQAGLAAHPPAVRVEWEARSAAVLVPLYSDRGEWHVLLTQRTETLQSHKGQVAFPGGRADPEDASPADTALREAWEEIGLRREDVIVLGQLDDLLTVTQWRITPIVGTIPWPYRFVPSEVELSHIFGVPLRWLADGKNVVVQYREPIAPGPKIPVYHFYYGQFDIWGATARIIRNLLEVLSSLPHA